MCVCIVRVEVSNAQLHLSRCAASLSAARSWPVIRRPRAPSQSDVCINREIFCAENLRILVTYIYRKLVYEEEEEEEKRLCSVLQTSYTIEFIYGVVLLVDVVTINKVEFYTMREFRMRSSSGKHNTHCHARKVQVEFVKSKIDGVRNESILSFFISRYIRHDGKNIPDE